VPQNKNIVILSEGCLDRGPQGTSQPDEEPAVRFSRPRLAAPWGIRPLLYVLTLLFLLSVLSFPASARISYSVSLDHPDQHLFNVTVTVPVDGRELTTAMPAWNALYQIGNFAERIRGVTAICPSLEAVPLRVRALDKQSWRISSEQSCQPGDHSTFQIRYAIVWNEPGPFESQLSARHAFVNLAQILMYVPDRRAEAVAIQFANLPAGWHTAAALEAGREANSYIAASYDSLVDAPVEAGAFDEFSFGSGHSLFHVVLDGKGANKSRLEGYLRQITAYQMQLMRDAPFDPPSHDYTFLIHVGSQTDVGGGGMEHRNGTAIGCASAEECAELAAHEFFHTWNVKRIRPQSLEPVDYTREQYSRSLWFAEGVTSAYASFTMERTGLWSKDSFYRDLTTQIARLQSRPARLSQSAEESSLDAWFEGYADYNAPERSISYYNKGQILGVMLDLAIRDATNNHESLDDVMRRMNDEYAKAGKYYDDNEGIRAAVEEVSGKSFKDFFARYVSGTDEIPYNDFLSAAGLALKQLPSGSNGAQFSISEIPGAADRQRRIRDGFLRGTTN
jgi:predicted metalloprotease with PDZ domain